MPNPISASNQTLDYTPAEPEEEGGVCVAPEDFAAGEAEPSAGEAGFRSTYGDGKIHREGGGLRVDPAVTQEGTVSVLEQDVDVTLTGIGALLAATDRNGDGSQGARLAASLSLAQATLTVPNHRGDEASVSLELGVGADVWSGTRDADGDGNDEYCIHVSVPLGVVSLGFGGCTEAIPAFIGDVSEGLGP